MIRWPGVYGTFVPVKPRVFCILPGSLHGFGSGPAVVCARGNRR
jgi:hypothetical protein